MNTTQYAENSRLDELESRMAFQDDLIEDLNRVIARQDRELAELTRRIGELETRIADVLDAAGTPGAPAGHEVPPHY